MINTHMSTHTVSTENHLAPTFFGLCWCRLNSFVLVLLSSLKSFGFNTTVSWENTKVFTWVCLCIYSFTLLLLYFLPFQQPILSISANSSTILNYSLFSFSTRKTIYVYHICSLQRRSSSNIYLLFLL